MIEIINHLFNALQKKFHIEWIALKFKIAHAAFAAVSRNKQVVLYRIQNLKIPELISILVQQMITETMNRTDIHLINTRNRLSVQRFCNTAFHRLRSLFCESKSNDVFRSNLYIAL